LPSCPVFEKNTFLFKISIWGVSLWHFHVYMYYIQNWFIPSIFFHFYLSPLLMVIWTGLKILYSFLYRKYINHIHLLYFLLNFHLKIMAYIPVKLELFHHLFEHQVLNSIFVWHLNTICINVCL
jgi:hypothetical protein